MKKTICSILCLLALCASLCACTPSFDSLEEASSALASQLPSLKPLASPAATETSEATQPPEPVKTPEATQLPVPAETPAPSPMPSPTSAGPRMYSSWAHLVSFDPDTGIAQFDYFDMLYGGEAVEYLVENEGFTEAEAKEYLEPDSVYVEKNTNAALRAIDIDDVSLALMWQANGNHVPDVESVPSSASDFRNIYKLDADLLLDSYPFYIEVNSDGEVTLVKQVYRA